MKRRKIKREPAPTAVAVRRTVKWSKRRPCPVHLYPTPPQNNAAIHTKEIFYLNKYMKSSLDFLAKPPGILL